MSIVWKSVRANCSKWLRKAGLAAAIVAALYAGTLQPLQSARSDAEQKATRLAWSPQSMWRQENLPSQITGSREQESIPTSYSLSPALNNAGGDVIGGSLQAASMMEPSPSPPTAPDSADRKLVRTDSLELIVQHPADSAERIRALAEQLGGYLENSEVSGDQEPASASLAIRVPAARFEEARAAIRKLGLRVEDERVEAQDVTKQYVDEDAQLRNLRAEEAQYLAILKHAFTVRDTLAVSEKLNEVRGQIEQQQAEFDALSRQTETVAIAVTLRAEADAQVLGLHWRPLYRLKIAARQGLDSLGTYLSAMTTLAFCVPTILLWFASILIGAALGWRILRWCVRIMFVFPKSAATAKEAN